MRIYRQQKKQLRAIKLELDFMEYLRAHGILIPRIIANTSGEQITSQKLGDRTWQIIVMEYVEGEHIKSYPRKLLLEMSEIQAKIHSLSSLYKGNLVSTEHLTKLRESYFISQIPLQTIKDSRLKQFLQRAQAYTVNLPPELPSGLCHLDYDTDNVLAKDNSVVAVLDFDDLAVAPFIVCLAYTLWHVYVHGDKQATSTYLNQYEKGRKLSDLELEYIRSIMLFRHYVISAVKVLNGHSSPKEIARYLSLEEELR
jgi:Ser/Thr protein kinase RdoA (MazF antagonist)